MRVIIESPFAGDIDRNLAYLREAMRDCCMRGESPYASHALLTQPGVLNDDDPVERRLGIALGFEWRESAQKTVVYCDYGITPGMRQGINNSIGLGIPVEYRDLY